MSFQTVFICVTLSKNSKRLKPTSVEKMSNQHTPPFCKRRTALFYLLIYLFFGGTIESKANNEPTPYEQLKMGLVNKLLRFEVIRNPMFSLKVQVSGQSQRRSM